MNSFNLRQTAINSTLLYFLHNQFLLSKTYSITFSIKLFFIVLIIESGVK